MTSHTATSLPSNAEAASPRDLSKAADIYDRLVAIERSGLAPKERAEAFLAAVSQSFNCLAASMTIGVSGDEFDPRFARPTEGIAAWTGTLDTIALEARSHAKSIARLFGRDAGTPEFAIIACPIDSAGRDPFGGIAILVRCAAIPDAERLQLHLRSACVQAAGMLARPSVARRPGIEMDDIARVYNKAGQFSSLHEFAYAITNAARQRFNCEQAAMGWIRPSGRVRLLCISGLDTIKKRSPGVQHIEQAMGECLDLAQPVVGQAADKWEDAGFAQSGKLHNRWRTATNSACVLSIPVIAGEEIVAVVSFRRSPDQPFDADDVEAVSKLLAPLAGALPLVDRATTGLLPHARHSVASVAGWMLHRGSKRKRLAIAAAAVGAAWLLASSSSYRVNAPATVTAERERVVAAPIQGTVAEVLIRSGDRVVEGTPLFRMDTTELIAQRNELRADLAATEVRLRNALALDDPSSAAIASAERFAHSVRLESIDARIESAEVRSPVTGTVFGPELDDAAGQVVAAGHPMFSIAEEGALTLEIHVPESRVADLQPGSPVRFASHARPEEARVTTLRNLAPAAAPRDGVQVFIADAVLPTDLDWVRPGMEGVAIIDAGERPNWWIASHGILDVARLRFWID